MSQDYSKIKTHQKDAPRTEEKKKVVPIAKVTKKKQKLSKRLANELTGDDSRTGIGSYILTDIVLPAAKDVLLSAITNGARMLIFGKDAPGPTNTYGGNRTSYKPKTDYSSSYRPAQQRGNSIVRGFDSSVYIFDTRDEAQSVLDQLLDMIDQYGQASLSDFYESVGETPTYTDNNYGWINLQNARIAFSSDGYYINLPKAILFR